MKKTKLRKLDYNQIDKHIYIGTNMCCTIALDPELVKKGITADISLEEKKVDAPLGVDYYVWLPTRDHFAPQLKKLLFGVQCIDYFVKNNIKIFVHCKNGHTRAPTLVVAYYIYKGMKINEAITFVKAKRTQMHLSASQKRSLLAFQHALKKYGTLLFTK